eukprot:gb/GECH01001635.1/.p1 GENE.gb/GECH01001635.1/~~gb/GECH01001635.1/.p1  ORF type:complete len:497 (+),score=201.51 gb/GECH01001635.1/:1-1491(+)
MSKPSNITYRVYKDSQENSNGDFVPVRVKSGTKTESKHKLREVRNEAGVSSSQPQRNPIKEMMMYPPVDSDEEEGELILDPKSDLFGFPDDGYDYTQHLDRVTGDGVYVPSGGMRSEDIEAGIDPELLRALEDEEADEVYEIDSDDSGDYRQVYGHRAESDSDSETKKWFNEGIQPEDVIKTPKKKRKQQSKEPRQDQEIEEVEEIVSDLDDDQYHFENEGREILEERFAEVMKMYDDDEIGELEEDDPTVHGTEDIRDHYAELEEFWNERNVPTWHQQEQIIENERAKQEEEQKILDQIELPEGMTIAKKSKPKEITLSETAKITKERFLNEDDEDSDDPEYEEVEVSKSPDYDIESFHSMHSNAYNHPSIIRDDETEDKTKKKKKPKIQLSKQGIPIGVLGDAKQENENDTRINDNNETDVNEDESNQNINLGKKRPKKESKEEKRQRKKEVKQQKKEKRQRKKQLKEKFHAEEQRQGNVVRHRENQKKTMIRY